MGTSVIATLLGSASTSAEEPKNRIFAGAIASEKSIDGLVNYTHSNGAQVAAEVLNKNLTDAQTYFSAGARTPKFFRKSLRLDAIADFDTKRNWAYTAFGEVFPNQDVTLRTGAIQSSNGSLGGFLGCNNSNSLGTFDIDIWYDGKKLGTQGYFAVKIGQNFYLSIGGNSNEKLVTTSIGWSNPGKFGFYNEAKFDIDNEIQTGKLFIGDKFIFTTQGFDFRNHFQSGTEMRRVTTGHVLDAWPPFDAFFSERFSFTFKWYHDKQSTNLDGRFFYRIMPQVFVGNGLSYIYDKEHKPIIDLQVYSAIPRTPLEAWVDFNINLLTVKTSVTAYFGAVKKF